MYGNVRKSFLLSRMIDNLDCILSFLSFLKLPLVKCGKHTFTLTELGFTVEHDSEVSLPADACAAR